MTVGFDDYGSGGETRGATPPRIAVGQEGGGKGKGEGGEGGGGGREGGEGGGGGETELMLNKTL